MGNWHTGETWNNTIFLKTISIPTIWYKSIADSSKPTQAQVSINTKTPKVVTQQITPKFEFIFNHKMFCEYNNLFTWNSVGHLQKCGI